MGSVTLLPSVAVDRVCHEDQMTIWTGEVAGALSLAGHLREDLEYAEVIDLHRVLAEEIRRVVSSAMNHPEARTTIRRP